MKDSPSKHDKMGHKKPSKTKKGSKSGHKKHKPNSKPTNNKKKKKQPEALIPFLYHRLFNYIDPKIHHNKSKFGKKPKHKKKMKVVVGRKPKRVSKKPKKHGKHGKHQPKNAHSKHPKHGKKSHPNSKSKGKKHPNPHAVKHKAMKPKKPKHCGKTDYECLSKKHPQICQTGKPCKKIFIGKKKVCQKWILGVIVNRHYKNAA